jgi:cytochrome c2
MKLKSLLALSALVLAALACGPNNQSQSAVPSSDLTTALPVGDPAHGEQLFKGQVNGEYPCSVCHSLTPGKTLIGPSLAGIASTAATRKSGYTAEMYLRESILSPEAFTVPGFHSGIMPTEFAKQMDNQQLADLIAFLLTQK